MAALEVLSGVGVAAEVVGRHVAEALLVTQPGGSGWRWRGRSSGTPSEAR